MEHLSSEILNAVWSYAGPTPEVIATVTPVSSALRAALYASLESFDVDFFGRQLGAFKTGADGMADFRAAFDPAAAEASVRRQLAKAVAAAAARCADLAELRLANIKWSDGDLQLLLGAVGGGATQARRQQAQAQAVAPPAPPPASGGDSAAAAAAVPLLRSLRALALRHAAFFKPPPLRAPVLVELSLAHCRGLVSLALLGEGGCPALTALDISDTAVGDDALAPALLGRSSSSTSCCSSRPLHLQLVTLRLANARNAAFESAAFGAAGPGTIGGGGGWPSLRLLDVTRTKVSVASLQERVLHCAPRLATLLANEQAGGRGRGCSMLNAGQAKGDGSSAVWGPDVVLRGAPALAALALRRCFWLERPSLCGCAALTDLDLSDSALTAEGLAVLLLGPDATQRRLAGWVRREGDGGAGAAAGAVGAAAAAGGDGSAWVWVGEGEGEGEGGAAGRQAAAAALAAQMPPLRALRLAKCENISRGLGGAAADDGVPPAAAVALAAAAALFGGGAVAAASAAARSGPLRTLESLDAERSPVHAQLLNALLRRLHRGGAELKTLRLREALTFAPAEGEPFEAAGAAGGASAALAGLRELDLSWSQRLSELAEEEAAHAAGELARTSADVYCAALRAIGAAADGIASLRLRGAPPAALREQLVADPGSGLLSIFSPALLELDLSASGAEAATVGAVVRRCPALRRLTMNDWGSGALAAPGGAANELQLDAPALTALDLGRCRTLAVLALRCPALLTVDLRATSLALRLCAIRADDGAAPAAPAAAGYCLPSPPPPLPLPEVGALRAANLTMRKRWGAKSDDRLMRQIDGGVRWLGDGAAPRGDGGFAEAAAARAVEAAAAAEAMSGGGGTVAATLRAACAAAVASGVRSANTPLALEIDEPAPPTRQQSAQAGAAAAAGGVGGGVVVGGGGGGEGGAGGGHSTAAAGQRAAARKPQAAKQHLPLEEEVAQLEARLADASLSRAVRFGLTRTLGQKKSRLEQKAQRAAAAATAAAAAAVAGVETAPAAKQ